MDIKRDRAFHLRYNRQTLVFTDANIVQTLADTGWHSAETNLDSTDREQHSRRYRAVQVRDVAEPVLLLEYISLTVAGGSIGLNGGYVPDRKTKYPHLHHGKKASTSLIEVGKSLIEGQGVLESASDYRKRKGKYMHPRFTDFKGVLRKIQALDEKRGKKIQAYRKRVCAQYTYPFPASSAGTAAAASA